MQYLRFAINGSAKPPNGNKLEFGNERLSVSAPPFILAPRLSLGTRLRRAVALPAEGGSAGGNSLALPADTPAMRSSASLPTCVPKRSLGTRGLKCLFTRAWRPFQSAPPATRHS